MVLKRVSAVVLAFAAALVVSMLAWNTAQGAQGEAYEQVVDNADKDRFEASEGWKRSDSGKGIQGKGYRLAEPKTATMRSQGAGSGALAAFKLRLPSDGEYAVYARWPQARGLNKAARVEVDTADGIETTEVDQTHNGGRWVRVGIYEMRAGDQDYVRISRDSGGEGNIAADAVKVVRMSSSEAEGGEEETAPQEEEQTTPVIGSSSSDAERTTSATRGDKVIAQAKRYKGIRYRYATCTSSRMSCVCLTKKAFAPFISPNLSMKSEEAQARRGKYVAKSNLRRGDLVYFREGGGSDITHVGIYAGRGYLWHASSYFGKVVKSEMKYIRGYAGARRLV